MNWIKGEVLQEAVSAVLRVTPVTTLPVVLNDEGAPVIYAIIIRASESVHFEEALTVRGNLRFETMAGDFSGN